MTLTSPYPYFGGKRRIATEVWRRFGADIFNYSEPFFGSGAVLLSRPQVGQRETVNDADGMIANFWRATKYAPDLVAELADYPVSEIDLQARRRWLIGQREPLTERLMADHRFYDIEAAAAWVWGAGLWIGGGWCRLDENRRPHLGAGAGVHRVSLAGGRLGEYFHHLAARLRRVRVLCGDWSRCVSPGAIIHPLKDRVAGVTGIFLDPPYAAEADRHTNIYAVEDLSVSHQVRQWAIENGDDPRLRIALCGYEGEHTMPDDWAVFAWDAGGGMARGRNRRGMENAKRERIWFSPHCQKIEQPSLFDLVGETNGH